MISNEEKVLIISKKIKENKVEMSRLYFDSGKTDEERLDSFNRRQDLRSATAALEAELILLTTA